MSWSVNYIGKPQKVVEALNTQSTALSGQSKTEYDEALPHLVALVEQNFGTPYLINLSAAGHGLENSQDPEKSTRQLTASIAIMYGILV